jgi:hypothetical protein
MKPQVHGLHDPKTGWFYVVNCPRCQWSWNWDNVAKDWQHVVDVAMYHWYMYSDTTTCGSGR